MDVREKLVELLKEADRYEFEKTKESGVYDSEAAWGYIADSLIAHGVTAQECGHWISLTECANAGVYCSVCHKKVYKEDYAWCNRKNKLRSDYCPHCGTKMTTQPPKGE